MSDRLQTGLPGQGKVEIFFFFPGQGKVREFLFWSGNFTILLLKSQGKVKEL